MSGRHLPGATPTRVSYPLGTRIESSDLRETRDYEALLMALHVRGGHGTWGVAQGLTVSLLPGGQEVEVSAGIGFDAHGRALLLSGATRLRAPSGQRSGEGWALVLERGADCPTALTVECEVTTPGTRLPGARLAWRSLARADVGGCPTETIRTALPLAHFRIQPGGALTRLPGRPPPRVQALGRPPLGAGTAVGTSLNWSWLSYYASARVDTREAGFATAPAYFVRPSPTPDPNAVGPFIRIAAVTSGGFRLDVAFAARTGVPAPDSVALAREMTFSWFGIEDRTTCGTPFLLFPGGPVSWNGRPIGLDLLLYGGPDL